MMAPKSFWRLTISTFCFARNHVYSPLLIGTIGWKIYAAATINNFSSMVSGVAQNPFMASHTKSRAMCRPTGSEGP
jgi:hypothetical protein